jgi:hypothetical protein
VENEGKSLHGTLFSTLRSVIQDCQMEMVACVVLHSKCSIRKTMYSAVCSTLSDQVSRPVKGLPDQIRQNTEGPFWLPSALARLFLFHLPPGSPARHKGCPIIPSVPSDGFPRFMRGIWPLTEVHPSPTYWTPLSFQKAGDNLLSSAFPFHIALLSDCSVIACCLRCLDRDWLGLIHISSIRFRA